MANAQEKELPLFQPFATAAGFLTDEEMDRLIADHEAQVGAGKLGFGNTNAEVRRSQVLLLGAKQKYRWLYERIWAAASECNRQFFCVHIAGIEPNIQLARYDASNSGFYTWHTDFAGLAPQRKISISVQLSRSEDYDGGDLELMYGIQPQAMARARSAFIAFPSFMLHRVTPVTRGTRWSLVAWVLGTRWS